MNQNNQCYVYKWTHLPTFKWYIGSRTSKTAHPNDGYICSSRIVKPMIQANPNEWARTIIAVGTKDEMYSLESEILQTLDARSDSQSFNRSNNISNRFDKTGVKESEITRKKKSQAHTGRCRPEHSQAMMGRIGHWRGKSRPDQTGENNPNSKCYVIIPPNGLAYEVWAIKSYIKQQGWPLGTAMDLVSGRYIPKKGPLKGYRIQVKDATNRS